MKTIAYIFARGGSKGLPGKNLRILCGKPLIAWSIEHALAVKRIDHVIVSTDSKDIAEVSARYGAEVPFMRPKDLAEDDTPEWLAWQHALTNYPCELMVSVPATAPLRFASDIDKCLDEYERGLADVVITVTDAHRSPYFNMVRLNPKNEAELVIPPQNILNRRQDTPKLYDMTTVCYVASTKFVLENDSIFEGCIRAVQVPKERAIDIDSLLDFQIAENLMTARLQSRES
jgi:CMP-N-acetylneuraminic acid synthetase